MPVKARADLAKDDSGEWSRFGVVRSSCAGDVQRVGEECRPAFFPGGAGIAEPAGRGLARDGRNL